MTMPNFLILGAPKAGTTALYEYLKQHPEIYMSPVKEPNFFAFEGKQPDFRGLRDERAWTNQNSIVDREAYETLFSGVTTEKAIGEASTLYLYIPETPARIKAYIPNAKLIAILRHPVERAFSNYLHLRRDGREWLTDFKEALQQEQKRIQNYWAPAWYYQEVGKYTPQIQRYFEIFDRSQIQIELYEDWKNHPTEFVQKIFTFLEVDKTFVPNMTEKYNQTPVVWKNLLLRDFFLRPNKLKQILRPLIPARIRKPMAAKIFNKNMETPPKLTVEMKQELTALFRDDILQLQDLINRDLSHWLV